MIVLNDKDKREAKIARIYGDDGGTLTPFDTVCIVLYRSFCIYLLKFIELNKFDFIIIVAFENCVAFFSPQIF